MGLFDHRVFSGSQVGLARLNGFDLGAIVNVALTVIGVELSFDALRIAF